MSATLTPSESEFLSLKIGEAILPLLDMPFALYGHSIGAAVAYHLTHWLGEKYGKNPVCFSAAGWIAPHLKSPFRIIDNITEEQIRDDSAKQVIVEHLKNLGIPDQILNNQRLLDEIMPSVKTDILLGKRMPLLKTKILNCPVVAIAGKRDTVFTQEQIKGWKEQTSHKFKFETVSGGHLFMRENRDELVDIIGQHLIN